MTKEEIVSEISCATGIETEAVAKVIGQFMTEVKSSLAEGHPVTLRGFGTFTIRTRAERMGRNISKGESMMIPARKVVKFIPAQDFRSKVAQS